MYMQEKFQRVRRDCALRKKRCLPAGLAVVVFLILTVIPPTEFTLAADQTPDEAAKPSVAVVEFDAMGELDIKDGGAMIAEWLVSALGREGCFALKERILLKKVLAEQKLVLTGLVDEEQTAAKIGRLYGVEAVVSGSIFRWGESLTVTARLIDSETGAIRRTAQIQAGDINSIPPMINSLAAVLCGTAEQATQVSGPGTEGGAALLTSETSWTEPTTAMQFVRLEGGCYRMGQGDKEKKLLLQEYGQQEYDKLYADELPLHEVCVDSFWLAAREVSNRQFKLFRPEHDSLDSRGISMNNDEQPVVYVSWDEAQAYADWLTSKNPGRVFRLPSEAEWEFGCRAGTETPRFWGWDSDEACRFANVHDRGGEACNKFGWPPHDCDDGFAATAPVGSFAPNPLGLYDMLGNVWEWTTDLYLPDAYQKHEKKNPLIENGGVSRVRRGGAWNNEPGSVRCANRGKRAPNRQNNRIGFRLLMVEKAQ